MPWDRAPTPSNQPAGPLARGRHRDVAIFLQRLRHRVQRAIEGPETRRRLRQLGRLLAHPTPCCPRCGTGMAPAAITEAGCPDCRDRRLPWRGLVRLGGYTEPLADYLVALKYRRIWSWAPLFGQALGRELVRRAQREDPHVPLGPAVVCHVPMHWRRRCVRGFDQAALIAHALAQECHWPTLALLRRQRATPPQAHLTPSQRRLNMRRAFALNRPMQLRGCPVVLVDDIRTTGASLRACARLLKQAGAGPITVAVVAVADRHTDPHRR